MRLSPIAAAIIASCAYCGAAQAAPVTFFGQDFLDPISSTPYPQQPRPNADAAKDAFLAGLTSFGTETFDAIADGTKDPVLTFAGIAKAALSGGSGEVETGVDQANGRFPTSGERYYLAGEVRDGFTISFDSAVSAFGFYGTDIGDYGGTLTLLLTDAFGAQSDLVVALTSGTGGSTDANVLYFGFYDLGTQYKSIQFTNPSRGGDWFGFDDMTVGSFAPSPVAEPGALALTALALLGLGLQRRRQT
jgi:hypothetical protein